MNKNSLIEIGSKADVVIRFNADTEINGSSFLQNEPYLFLKDVNVSINYSNQGKVADTSPKNQMASSLIYPTGVSIGNVKFSRKIASLLSCFKNTGQAFNPTIMKSLIADEDTIYLTDEIELDGEIFVYDSNFDKVDFTYVEASNSITSLDFVDTNEYIVVFSSAALGTRFDLKKPWLPYMNLEIQGIGNIDKMGKKVNMRFLKVSLDSVLNFNFLEDGVINAPLNFVVLEANNYIIFGE